MKKTILVLLITVVFYGILWLAMDVPRDYSGLEAISGSPGIAWFSPLVPQNGLQFSCYIIYLFGVSFILKKKRKTKMYQIDSTALIQGLRLKNS